MNFENKKIVEIVLYILEKTRGIDYYHVFKILYFAELKHLAKWGERILPDNYCALKYGPVPSHLYDAVKSIENPRSDLSQLLADNVKLAGDDAPNTLLARRNCDMNYISQSEREALDASINENAALTFWQLVQKSHDGAWFEAQSQTTPIKIISPLAMAKVMGVDSAMLDYIQDQIEINAALR